MIAAMELRSLGSYRAELRPVLPDAVFAPARSRLWWLPVHALVIGSLTFAIATRRVPALLWPAASIVIGVAMAFVAFLGHEVLHGAVVRGRVAVGVVGWICMMPFTVSPTLWTHWHNRVHHHHAMMPGADPDLYPTIDEYRSQPFARIMADYFGLGGRSLRSVISLLFGFTGQSQQMLWEARRLGILTAPQQRRALLETALGMSVWGGLAVLVGGVAFVFVYAIPLVIANVIAMSFILTNHSLSPLTRDVNDPLINSLSVTLPRALEWLSLDFGFHVEHHLFPGMSARHGRVVRARIEERYPGRYQSMPLSLAMRALYDSGRVYLDDTTLVDPRTGRTVSTLLPRGADRRVRGASG